jgi:type IV pilus assembly protein PilN
MIRINLLPVRVSKKKVAGRQQLYLLALAVVLVVAGNYVWSSARGEALSSREQKLRRTKDEIAQLERIIGEVKDIKAQQKELKDKLAVLDKLRAGRQGPVKVLDDLATIVPRRLWLRKMDEKSGAVVFEGTASTIDDVSAFMSALRRSPYFRDIELRKTTGRQEKRFKVVDFTVTATADYTPAASVAAGGAPPPPPAR